MKYKLNPGKILNKYEDDDIDNIAPDKTYFCSELIASAYKCLDLLPKNIAASQYWPGTFSSKGNLQLMNGS